MTNRDNWKDMIQKVQENCPIFIVFLSRVAISREPVIDEIELALKRLVEFQKENPDPEIPLPIQVIYLESVPIEHFQVKGGSTEIVELWEKLQINKKQALYLSEEGFSKSFFERLLNNKDHFWNPVCDTPEKLKSIDVKHEIFEQPMEYIYPYERPQAAEIAFNDKEKATVKYYQVEPGQTSPIIQYPLMLDNQYFPEEFYEDPDFMKWGIPENHDESEWNNIPEDSKNRLIELNEKKNQRQMNEFCKALLHVKWINSLYTKRNEAGFEQIKWDTSVSLRQFSIIFRIGMRKITCVFCIGQQGVLVYDNKKSAGTGKSLFSLSYMAGDSEQLQNNCLTAETTVFEGLTRENGQVMINSILETTGSFSGLH